MTTNRFDTVATITVTMPDGTKLVDIPVRREDVTTTNGAYRCIRDTAVEEVAKALRAFITTERLGGDIDKGEDVAAVAAALDDTGTTAADIASWFNTEVTR